MLSVNSLYAGFYQTAHRFPDAPAVTDEGGTWTYRELVHQAARLGSCLYPIIQPGEPVAVYADRGRWYAAGVLAALLLGAPWAPVDPKWPIDRIRRCLDDLNGPILSNDELPSGVNRERVIRMGGNALYEVEAPPPVDVSPESPAYVIYTSGSTGAPKGVVVPHAGVPLLLEEMQQLAPVPEGCRWSWWTNPSFDVSVYEMWAAWLAGGELVAPAAPVQTEGRAYARWLCEQRITAAYVPPMMVNDLRNILESGAPCALKRLLVGVEPIPLTLLQRVMTLTPGLQIINGYGPTEATICCTLYPVKRDGVPGKDITPIGYPVKWSQIALVDDQGASFTGEHRAELWVSGPGVALEYWKDPDLTAQRFITADLGDGMIRRYYRTGDIVERSVDGVLHFVGRRDRQVKIRGQRVEPGESEAAIRSYPGVRDAVVLPVDRYGNIQLAGWYLADAPVEATELKDWLRDRLIPAAVPSALQRLEQWPMTPNGKIDRDALLRMLDHEQTDDILPSDSAAGLEQALVQAMETVLGVRHVRTSDHFLDLGGNSLTAVEAAAEASRLIGMTVAPSLFVSPGRPAEMAPLIRPGLPGYPEHIPPADNQRFGRLSLSQRRQWFLLQLDGSSAAYHIALTWRFDRPPDKARLQRALTRLVQAQPALRTRFTVVAGQPVQQVLDSVPVAVDTLSVDALSDEDPQAALERTLKAYSEPPFALDRAPLWRVAICRTESGTVLVLIVHHIVFDGWSAGLLASELTRLYGDPSAEALVPACSLLDFAEWQAGLQAAKDLAWWTERLRGAPSLLGLPLDRPRPAVFTGKSATVERLFAGPAAQRLRKAAKDSGCTLFAWLLAALQTVIWRWSGEEDITVGTFAAARSHPDLQRLMGLFVNTLPLRSILHADESFRQFVQRVNTDTAAAFDRQHVPYEQIIDGLNITRSTAYTPLVHVMLVLHNMRFPDVTLDGSTGRFRQLSLGHALVDLCFWVSEIGGQLSVSVEYATDLWDRQTIEILTDAWMHLLHDAAERPEAALRELRVATEASDVPATPADPAPHIATLLDRCLQTLQPDGPAIISHDGSLTLSRRDFWKEAHACAQALRAMPQWQSHPLMAVVARRSPHTLAAMAGALFAGGGYMPLSQDMPEAVLASMLMEARPAALAGTEDDHELLNRLQVIASKASILLIDSLPKGVQEICTPADSPAYVMYTSGSTGRPRGVPVSPYSLGRFTDEAIRYYGLSSEDKVLQFATLAFDASVEEIFPALCAGAALVLRSEDMAYSVDAFLQSVEQQKITVLDLPTAWWRLLTDRLRQGAPLPPSVRLVIIGGETAHWDTVVSFLNAAPQVRLVNTYGPTETTVVVTAAELSIDDPLTEERGIPPIGRPVFRAQCRVVDDSGWPAPFGWPGELWIGGECVSAGYLNRPADTAARFVRPRWDTGHIWYRSGDKVRQRPDGQLEFLGRLDTQIKWRGYRIEPDQIVRSLLAVDGVKDAVVSLWGDEGDGQLACWYAADSGVDASVLRSVLMHDLPAYMVPSLWARLDVLPLTPNGKPDLKRLPPPAPLTSGAMAADRPQTPVEEVIHDVWCDVLGMEATPVDRSFFDLGGHSLLVIDVIDRLASAGIRVSAGMFLQHPTVRGLARQASMARAGEDETLIVLREQGEASPLFIAHSTPGDVLGYTYLVRALQPGRPIYGFQSLGLTCPEKAHETLPDMAAHYIERMRSVQPEGPYNLLGWCYGGLVCAEMALQLQDAGQQVAWLFLIETPYPYTDMRQWANIARRAMQLVQAGPAATLKAIRARLRYRHLVRTGQLQRTFGLEYTGGLLANRRITSEKNLQAAAAYRLRRHPGAMVLINGSELADGVLEIAQDGWTLTRERVRRITISGNHETVLKRPHVLELAAVIDSCLQERR